MGINNYLERDFIVLKSFVFRLHCFSKHKISKMLKNITKIIDHRDVHDHRDLNYFISFIHKNIVSYGAYSRLFSWAY